MGSLTDQIRRLSGVAADAVADEDVQAALDAHRQWHQLAYVALEMDILSVAKRGCVDVWGWLEPTTNATTGTTTDLVDSTGADITGTWSLDADGSITFSADQARAGTLYLSAYSYDVNAAAVDVIDQALGTMTDAYDVKLGDQDFKRSQMGASLERRRDRCSRGILADAVQRERSDEAPAMTRRDVRLYRRAMRE